MSYNFIKMTTDVTDFVELGTFARRAPQDEETEESASHHVFYVLDALKCLRICLLYTSDAADE